MVDCPSKTAKEYFNEIVSDNKIISLYNGIHEYALKHGSYAHHDLIHVTNVSNYCEELIKNLNYDEEFIYETKIAAILHDTGCIKGKDGHQYRSYKYAKKYFKKNNIILKNQDLILEAIKNHSNGFETDNIIQIVLILADKLDVRKTRITCEGKNAIGNRQYQFVNDIKIDIKNDNLNIYFECDDKLDLDELNDYYFTKKIFNAVKSFSKKMNLHPNLFINNKKWEKFYED